MFNNQNLESKNRKKLEKLLGDTVIARVWKPKDKDGKIVSVLDAIRNDGNVGHVSLQIFVKGEYKLYISFWPENRVRHPLQEVKATINTLEADIRAETSEADSISYLVNLDGKKIIEAFFNYLKDTNSQPQYTLLPIANKVLRTILFKSNNSHNCCTMALNMVEAGLITLGTSNDIIRTQIEGMKQSVTDLDPILLAEFFENFSRHEEDVFENFNLRENKISFVEEVTQKFIELAKKGAVAELLLLQKTFPELYKKKERELYDLVHKAEKELEETALQYAASADLDNLEKLKHDNPNFYNRLKKKINEELRKALSKNKENTDIRMTDAQKDIKERNICLLKESTDKLFNCLQKELVNVKGFAPDACKTFVTTLLNALRKDVINQLINDPQSFAIPPEIAPFLFNYFYENPYLLFACQYQEEAKNLEINYLSSKGHFFSTSTSQITTHQEAKLSQNRIALSESIMEANKILRSKYTSLDDSQIQSILANLISAIRHNKLNDLLNYPENYSISLTIPKIQTNLTDIIKSFPNLQLAASFPDDAKAIEIKLNQNRLNELAEEIKYSSPICN